MILFHGDCLELMAKIESNSVDMVLADLPYGTTNAKWDIRIPFEPLWAELHRVSKSNSALAMFGSEPFSTLMRSSNLARFKYDWVWEKNCPTNHTLAHCMPMKSHEVISVFSEGKTYHASRSTNPMRYYPQGLRVLTEPKKRTNRFNSVTCNETPGKFKGSYEQKFTGYPRSVLNFDWVPNRSHPNEKPVALLEYLIKTYTSEGDTVLDPTMGSGSCGVACKNLNRKFIGIEKDEKYFQIAQRRIGE